MMNISDDTEELEDFIRLDFADLQASKNLQLLDPGIIDLECDSEEEFISIEEPETFRAQQDLHSQSVSTAHSNIVDLKPMCVKVVDCYKFPWYFDKFYDNIEQKLANNKNVEVDDGILDDSSTDPLKELVANTYFVDISDVDSVTMEPQANDCRKEVTELNKDIDVIPEKESLENKKPIPGDNSARNNMKNNKMDFDIRRAMEQRKNSVVDLKKNIGLVGMKILRLPNKTPSKLPIEISIGKQLKKPMEVNTEKVQENKQERGPTIGSHVKALDEVLTNVTSTTPVFENTVERMRDGVSTQNISGISISEPIIRSISALVETKTNSNDTPPDRRCNFENEFSLELSVNKIAEQIYRLVRPHKYADNQTIVPNSCNIMTNPTKVTKEKIIKKSKYQSESTQKYIAEGTRTTKMIDPIPISPKNRKKDRMKNHLQSINSEIIDISDEISPKQPSRKSETTKISAEANTVSNKAQENIKNHKGKEMSSNYQPSTSFIAKPKIGLSTKKPNKLTETIFKIKEMHQKESSISEPTKSQKQSSNMTPSSTFPKSLNENRFLPKQDTGDVIPYNKKVGTPEQLLNGNDESKNIKNSTAQFQYSNSSTTHFENALSKNNYPQNTPKNKVSTDLKHQKPPEKEAEKESENNYSKSAQIITESSVTVNRDESKKNKSSRHTEEIIVDVKLIDSSTKKKPKQHHGINQCPAVNPTESASILSNRETMNSCTKFDTVSNHNSNVSNPAVIINTTTQNNQSPVKTEALTVYNSMQAHTLYKPPESAYKTFPQSQYNAVRFPSHIPQVNQPMYNTGHLLRNSTHHLGEILPHIDSRPPLSGVNEVLPLMSHIPRLPMPALQPTTFGAPMLNGMRPLPTRMTHPGPNGGFGAQMPSNPRPMSPFRVSSQISRPQGTVSPQMPMNYPHISISEMQSYDVLWSGPLSRMPPPPPPPPPPYQPASQDISTSSPKSVPQSMDSSIIGRNINGIVKKINITAPVIEQKEKIDSKAGIIENEHLERDASTPLYDEIQTDCFRNIETINTKQEMLRILDTELQRADSRFDVLTPADGIQNQTIQKSNINGRPNSKKENLICQGKLRKSPNETTSEQCNSSKRKSSNAVENFIKVDKTLSKDHQKNDKSRPQKKEHQHKSNHYLMNFIKKPKEKKDKNKEMPPKKCNEPVRNRVENVAELTVHESGNIKTSATQSSEKKPISNHLKYFQDSKKGNNSKKLSGKGSRTAFEDLFGDGIDDVGCEKVASDKKSTGKRHSGLSKSEKTHEKSCEVSVNMKRPANDEKPTLSPKYRPGPLSKKKKLNDQERVNPHQINKKQILQSKTYSDPILPIPTYEKILSNMPSYLCFRDDIKNSSVTASSIYKKTSGRVNPKIPDAENKKIEKEKERQKLDKAESIKKISLYEYKKRSTSERKVDHESKDNYKKHIEMHRRPSHADSDLGYDSDSTVKL